MGAYAILHSYTKRSSAAVSIKNKKTKTNNAYRLQKIEEYFISKGYVASGSCWVDCVEGGHDISFDQFEAPPIWCGAPAIPSSSLSQYARVEEPDHDNYFTIYMPDRRLYRTTNDPVAAVLMSRSRDNPCRDIWAPCTLRSP